MSARLYVRLSPAALCSRLPLAVPQRTEGWPRSRITHNSHTSLQAVEQRLSSKVRLHCTCKHGQTPGWPCNCQHCCRKLNVQARDRKLLRDDQRTSDNTHCFMHHTATNKHQRRLRPVPTPKSSFATAHPGTPVSDRWPCIGSFGCSTRITSLQATTVGNCTREGREQLGESVLCGQRKHHQASARPLTAGDGIAGGRRGGAVPTCRPLRTSAKRRSWRMLSSRNL